MHCCFLSIFVMKTTFYQLACRLQLSFGQLSNIFTVNVKLGHLPIGCWNSFFSTFFFLSNLSISNSVCLFPFFFFVFVVVVVSLSLSSERNIPTEKKTFPSQK